MQIACSPQFPVGLEAFLLLDGQFGAGRSTIRDVCPIDMPAGVHLTLEDNLHGTFAHLFLRDAKGDGILELSYSCSSYTYT